MKSFKVPNVDISAVRTAMKQKDLAPIGRRMLSQLFALKYNEPTGVLVDPVGGDFTPDSTIPGYTKPSIIQPSAMGGQTAIYFTREAGLRKVLKGKLYGRNTQFTLSFTYCLSSSLTLPANCVLFTFVSQLVDGYQKMLRFYAAGASGKLRVLTTLTTGAMVFGSSTNSVSVDKQLVQANISSSTKVIVSLVCDSVAGTVQVYINGALSETLSGLTQLTPLFGDLYLGVSTTIADNTADFYGSLGGMSFHDYALAASEVSEMYNFLNAAFSA